MPDFPLPGNDTKFTTPQSALRPPAPLTQGSLQQLLSGNGIKTIPCSPGPSPVNRPSSGGRIPGSRAAALVGVHRVETVGLFASFWSQKEGHSGWQPFPPEGGSKTTPPPLRGTSPCIGEA